LKFEEVIGQTGVKKNLVSLVRDNRLSHALLFLSKEGAGGLSLALALSQYIVCEKVSASGIPASLFDKNEGLNIPDDACGICSACQKASSLVHPDIHYAYPVVPRKSGDKPPISADYITEWREFVSLYPYGNTYDWLQFIGAENKQGNITATECNDIIRKLSLKSFESIYKVLVMWMPEYLGNEGNKLLKLIEEPPANTLFILVAQEESKVLSTIISRTQQVRIPALEQKDIESALILRASATRDAAHQAASVAEGNYREAMQLLQHAESDWQGIIRDWLNAALRTGPAEQVKWVNEVSALGREKQKQLLRYFNHLLEQSIRLRILGRDHLTGPENETDFAERFNKTASLSQQQAIIEELDKAVYYIERNANAKMLFQALTIKIYHIIRDNAITVLV
jgi:DNA polymerase III subunit delta'